MTTDFDIGDELDRLEKINNRSTQQKVSGNLLDEDMRNGIKDFSRLFSDRDIDYAVIGGIGTQLSAYSVSGLEAVEEHFEYRSTDDVDALVNDRNGGLQALEDDNYYELSHPDIHLIESGLIPGHEKIIDRAEEVELESVDVKVANPSDLIYTKVANPNLLVQDEKGKYGIEKKPGTFYDLKIMSDPVVTDVDEGELKRAVEELSVKPRDAKEVLRRAGYDIF